MSGPDSVEISGRTADGLGRALDQDFCRIESPERMAWIVWLLRRLEDRPEWFPRGKWATVQEIERQLGLIADYIAEGKGGENERT